ncbi:MAG: shufflon system plasmid conjugative transfer pilus tip adhesin PilV [Cytophagales bacterium]|nr:shufflon system plasmid conjugative transfer pilus tip adhesin PilV [Cytophagales bacterium]
MKASILLKAALTVLILSNLYLESKAQVYGGLTGHSYDTWIINNDNSNHHSVVRLQSGHNAWMLTNQGGGDQYLRFRYAGNTNHNDYGSNYMELHPTQGLRIMVSGAWFRNYGSSGWYNETHGGGIYMTDATWIRTYGNKSFYHNVGIMRTDGEFHVGSDGNRFRVTQGGNVGIGTTSPSDRLHVVGNTQLIGRLAIGTTNPSELVEIYANSANTPAVLFHKGSTASYKMGISGDGFKIAAMDGYGGHTGDFNNAANTQILSLTKTGRIGIGTTAPSDKLEVVGTMQLSGSDELQYKLIGSSKNVRLSLSGITPFVGTTTNTPFAIVTNRENRITVDSLGNVAVGTLTVPSGYLMAVNGKIKTKGVVVDKSDWADFVFAPGYQLRPLEEVESFIAQHGHLPDVPSEKEVVEQGLDVSAMQSTLMQKVEELTLYLLEMKKEINTLKAENEQLKAAR